jgi:aminoglycoside phosphotransferase
MQKTGAGVVCHGDACLPASDLERWAKKTGSGNLDIVKGVHTQLKHEI